MNTFAAFGLEGDEMMGLFLGALFLVTPIIFILTKHQQKMAELLHRRNENSDPQVQALSAQVERLTHALHAQTLAVDELSQKLNALPPAPAQEESPRSYLGT